MSRISIQLHNLPAIMAESGVTAKQLAEKLYSSPATVKRLMTGVSTTRPMAMRVADLLGKNLTDLMYTKPTVADLLPAPVPNGDLRIAATNVKELWHYLDMGVPEHFQAFGRAMAQLEEYL